MGVSLVFLSGGLFYAVFRDGGSGRADWQVSLVLVACAAIASLFSRAGGRPAALVFWPSVVLPVFAACQAVPLPHSLVRMMSPGSAAVWAALQPVVPDARYSFSIAPAATWDHCLRLTAYSITLLLLHRAVLLLRGRLWIPAIPLVLAGLGESILWLVQTPGASRALQGTYVNRNHFSGLLEMALPLMAIAAVAAASGRSRAVHTQGLSTGAALKTCGAISIAVIVFTALLGAASRGAVLSALGSFFVVALLLTSRIHAQRWMLRLGVAALAGCALALALFVLPPDNLVQRFGALASGDASTSGRSEIWRESLPLIGRFPLLGAGLGAYQSAFAPLQAFEPLRTVDFAHNDYLQYLIELGIPVWSMAVVALGTLLLATLRAVRTGPPGPRLLATGALGGMAALLFHSLTDFNLYIPANALAFAWLAGLASGAAARAAEPIVLSRAPMRATRGEPAAIDVRKSR